MFASPLCPGWSVSDLYALLVALVDMRTKEVCQAPWYQYWCTSASLYIRSQWCGFSTMPCREGIVLLYSFTDQWMNLYVSLKSYQCAFSPSPISQALTPMKLLRKFDSHYSLSSWSLCLALWTSLMTNKICSMPSWGSSESLGVA